MNFGYGTTNLSDQRFSAFKGAINRLAEQLGFSHYVVGRFPDTSERRMSRLLIATNWPQEILARYDSCDLYGDCEIVKRVKAAAMPVRPASLKPTGRLQKSTAPHPDFDPGFVQSIAFSVSDVEKRSYLFIFSGRPDITDCEAAVLLLEAMRAVSELVEDTGITRLLAAREVDCLSWAAAGKSSEDIAEILNLSPHTVNDYLQSAIRKLGAANRTQAVVAAIRMGIL